MRRIAPGAAILLAAAPAAAADLPGREALGAAEAAAQTPRTVLSLHALGLLSQALELQGERYLPGAAWSVAAGGGVRLPAGGDFRGLQLSAGLEVRRWLWRGWRWTERDGEPLGGLFVGGRLDAGWVRLVTAERREVGQSVRLTPALHAGYRALPFGGLPFAGLPFAGLEVTPTAGLGLTTDLDVRPAAPARPRLHALLGLTVGWLL